MVYDPDKVYLHLTFSVFTFWWNLAGNFGLVQTITIYNLIAPKSTPSDTGQKIKY